ncbi:hypothetical protein [Mycolicibacterium sarraceniae]|nr:hypothetical protein [Mycolicibacterium sarraceniae]
MTGALVLTRRGHLRGRGGFAYVLLIEYGIDLPREMQIDVARRVQALADERGVEVKPVELYDLFVAADSESALNAI